MRVLLVDDDQVDRKSILRALRHGSYLVTEAETLARAEACLADPPQAFDCVVLDFRLPDGTALDFLSRAREGREHDLAPWPVVVVTGAEGEAGGIESIALGAQDYMFKSEVSASSLARAIGYAIERHRLLLSLERRERQLRSAQRLEVIGQLAGGIAHDFNNLLAVIMGYTELAMQGLAQGRPILKHLEAVHSSGERATDLTRQLLSFGRRQFLEPSILHLNFLVEEVSQLLVSQLITDAVSLEFDLDPGISAVQADSSQLERVLLNLCLNARDAMPEGGTLTLATRGVELAGEETRGFGSLPAGQYVELSVVDTGLGMDAGTLERAFDPFFTTKQAGKGTGLGLASVKGFIQQSGGAVQVESEVGEGTAFRILLPANARGVTPPRKGPRPEAPRRTGSSTGGRILLVEDEPDVRALCEEVLVDAGFVVRSSTNGAEALRVFRADPSAFDLVLTDVTMPVMGGVELARAVHSLEPRLPLLFMSGYTEDVSLLGGNTRAELIKKPFRPRLLLERVGELLERPQVSQGPS